MIAVEVSGLAGRCEDGVGRTVCADVGLGLGLGEGELALAHDADHHAGQLPLLTQLLYPLAHAVEPRCGKADLFGGDERRGSMAILLGRPLDCPERGYQTRKDGRSNGKIVRAVHDGPVVGRRPPDAGRTRRQGGPGDRSGGGTDAAPPSRWSMKSRLRAARRWPTRRRSDWNGAKRMIDRRYRPRARRRGAERRHPARPHAGQYERGRGRRTGASQRTFAPSAMLPPIMTRPRPRRSRWPHHHDHVASGIYGNIGQTNYGAAGRRCLLRRRRAREPARQRRDGELRSRRRLSRMTEDLHSTPRRTRRRAA